MKKTLLFLFVFVCLNLSMIEAQTVDNFNYSGILTSNGWTSHSGAGTNPIATTTGLIYSGYINSGIGNAALIGNLGGEDVNFTAGVGPYNTNGATVYVSFLVNVTESASKTGDYFFHLGNRGSASSFTSFAARVFAKVTTGVVNFGISNTSTASYGTTNFAVNTTYLMVIKYTINTSGNDQADMWVLPAGVPASEAVAGTPEYSSTTTAGQDIINAIALRQGSSITSVQTVVDGFRIGSTWAEILPVPSAPVATAATNITVNGFTANWNTFTGSTGYFLDISTVSDFSSFIAGYNNKDAGNVTSLDINSLDPNTTYYYRVRSTDGTTTSPNSNVITVTTSLAAPNAKEASDISAGGFSANWDASAGATTYKLDVSTAADFSSFVTGYNNLDAGNATTFNVSSLSSNQTYYYRLRASNANGTSANSNVITVTTSSMAGPVAGSPTNIASGGFTANWSYAQPVTGYFLDVSTSSDFSTFVEGFNSKDVGMATSFNVSSLNSYTVYYYRVYASTIAGPTPNSNTISVTTLLGAPVATAATSLTTSGFKANWNLSNGAVSYWLDISTSSDFSTVLPAYNNKYVGTSTTSHVVTGLTAGTTYYYRISCANNFGSSPYSNTITVSTNVVGVQDEPSAIPSKYNLLQNYPNPFNPSTIIKYQLHESGLVTIKVYSILGNEICTLVNESKSAGTHEVRFDAYNLTSGTYIYKIQAGNYSQIKKMILVK